MKTTPVNERRPTLKELARSANELHRCLDQTQADVAHIKRELGLENGAKVAGLSSKWQAFRRTAFATTTSIVALALAYRILDALWPFLVGAAGALLHMAQTARI